MMKPGICGVLLIGAVFFASGLTPAMASDRHRHDKHQYGHSKHQHKHSKHQHGHYKPRHGQHVHYGPPHHHYGPPRPSGLRVGVFIGGQYGYPPYPYGYPYPVYGPPPVVVEKHIYHTTYVPVWQVYHYPSPVVSPQAFLHIVIAPRHGALYINGQYLGQAESFPDGRLQTPVAPGRHTVQLQLGGSMYRQEVDVRAGSTAMVEARLNQR